MSKRNSTKPQLNGSRSDKPVHPTTGSYFLSLEEDPAEFLEFRENLVHAIGNNARGEKTIEVFGLNRKELTDMRLTWFLCFRKLIPHVVELLNTREKIAIEIIEHPSPELTRDFIEINAQIERFIGDSAQYAAMVWTAFRAAS